MDDYEGVDVSDPSQDCREADCESPLYARGFCSKHYQAARTRGDLKMRPTRTRVGVCVVDDCDAPDRGAHGYCNKHHKRMKRHGSTEFAGRPGPPGFKWKGEDVAYITAHYRIRTARGSASEYACVDCDEAADHWSFAHACDNPLVTETGSPYCTHLEHYEPRCSVCHRRFDITHREAGMRDQR